MTAAEGLPLRGPLCQAVKSIADTHFEVAEAPHLPLHACTHKFRLLEDKRSGKEQREENNTACNDRAI